MAKRVNGDGRPSGIRKLLWTWRSAPYLEAELAKAADINDIDYGLLACHTWIVFLGVSIPRMRKEQ